jgi:hypothetical protein
VVHSLTRIQAEAAGASCDLSAFGVRQASDYRRILSVFDQNTDRAKPNREYGRTDEVHRAIWIDLGTFRTELQRTAGGWCKSKELYLNDYSRMILDKDDIIEPLDWCHSDFKSKLQEYLQRKEIEKGKARVH